MKALTVLSNEDDGAERLSKHQQRTRVNVIMARVKTRVGTSNCEREPNNVASGFVFTHRH